MENCAAFIVDNPHKVYDNLNLGGDRSHLYENVF
jgi:hypothetical protein